MTETVDKTIDQIQVGDVLVGMRRKDGSELSFFGNWAVIGEPRVAANIIPIRGEKEYHEDQDYQTYAGAIFRVKKESNMSNIIFSTRGKHGTITNSEGQKLTGIVRWATDYSDTFEFQIDNSIRSTAFLKSEWTFEADKLKLPTNALAVVKVDGRRYVRLGGNFYTEKDGYVYGDALQKLADKHDFEVLYDGE